MFDCVVKLSLALTTSNVNDFPLHWELLADEHTNNETWDAWLTKWSVVSVTSR